MVFAVDGGLKVKRVITDEGVMFEFTGLDQELRILTALPTAPPQVTHQFLFFVETSLVPIESRGLYAKSHVSNALARTFHKNKNTVVVFRAACCVSKNIYPRF